MGEGKGGQDVYSPCLHVTMASCHDLVAYHLCKKLVHKHTYKCMGNDVEGLKTRVNSGEVGKILLE